MTDDYRAPLADAQPPTYDGLPLGAAFSADAGDAARSRPVVARANAVVDAALHSPRWDRVRGLVILACVTVVGIALALVATTAFVVGCALLIRQMWEAVS